MHEKKKKKKRKEMRTYRFLFSTESQVFSTPQKVTNLSKHGAYIEFFLGKIPLCPQKALNKEGKKGKKKEKRKSKKSQQGGERFVWQCAKIGTNAKNTMLKIQCQNWHQCQNWNQCQNPMPIFLHGRNLHHTNAKIGTNANFCSNAKINAKIGIVPKMAPVPIFANFRIMRILAPIFLLFFFHSSSAPALLQFLFCSYSSKLQYGFKLGLDSSCSTLSSVRSEDGEVFVLQNYQNPYKMLLVTQ